jgi:benzoyl-CoA reductase/2-hydroxyglutaryl-CoA dehydratase subunit BcrC/BadD/HgdB
MAAAYTSIFSNRSREYKVHYLGREFSRYGVDAAVFHDARTCPDHSTSRYGVHLRLRRDTGVPPIVFEGDTHDLRLVSIDHFRGQLDEFLEQRREARDGAEARVAASTH